MKLKHWQGYGSVNAVKVEDKPTEVTILVTGLHEYGLVLEDVYDAKKWLLDRLCPKYKDIPYWKVTLFVYEENYKRALYTFRPKDGLTWKEVK